MSDQLTSPTPLEAGSSPEIAARSVSTSRIERVRTSHDHLEETVAAMLLRQGAITKPVNPDTLWTEAQRDALDAFHRTTNQPARVVPAAPATAQFYEVEDYPVYAPQPVAPGAPVQEPAPAVVAHEDYLSALEDVAVPNQTPAVQGYEQPPVAGAAPATEQTIYGYGVDATAPFAPPDAAETPALSADDSRAAVNAALNQLYKTSDPGLN